MRGEGVEDLADGLAHGIGSAGGGLAEQVLELGEGLLDRVEIRGILGQEDQLGADGSDSAAHDLALVTAEIVQDDDVAWPQGRNQHLLDIDAEPLSVDRSIDQPGRLDAITAQGSQEGHGLPAAVRNLGFEPCASLCPSPERRHVGLGPGLIEKYQAAGIDPVLILTPLRAPSRDVGTILLAGQRGFF